MPKSQDCCPNDPWVAFLVWWMPGVRDGLVASIVLCSVAWLPVNVAHAAPSQVEKSAAKLPAFDVIERTVREHFTGLSGYEQGDLITGDEVEAALAKLAAQQCRLPGAKQIAERTPRTDGYLAKTLRTKQGRAFMHDVRDFPLAYDRLDRLADLPHGKRTIEALVRGPDGYKMLEYMTSTKEGKNLGKLLSAAPKGKDFNKPTGRIYTVDGLVEALKADYARAVAGGAKR